MNKNFMRQLENQLYLMVKGYEHEIFSIKQFRAYISVAIDLDPRSSLLKNALDNLVKEEKLYKYDKNHYSKKPKTSYSKNLKDSFKIHKIKNNEEKTRLEVKIKDKKGKIHKSIQIKKPDYNCKFRCKDCGILFNNYELYEIHKCEGIKNHD